MTDKTLIKGDHVIMHTCDEAEHYKGRIWTCRSDQFIATNKEKVVFLEGFSGYFVAGYLKKVDVQELYNEAEAQRIRAESAEQERDKLLEKIGAAQRVLLQVPGAMTFESVAGMLNIVLEGSQPDGRE